MDGEEGPLLGRTRELASLFERLGRARAGAGQVVMIEGEGGIGKTRLVDELLGRATSEGFAAVRSEAEELERTRPFASLAEAFGCRPGAPDAARARIGRLVTGQEEASEFQLVEEFCALAEDVAARDPLVVGVEDLHWADPSTLRALRSLGRRLRSSPVLIVVTFRPAPRSRELDELVRRFVADGAAHHAVRPLEPAFSRELVESVIGAAPGSELTRQIGRAGGNPLFVRELARWLVDEGVLDVDAGVAELSGTPTLPPSLRRAVLGRLAPLTPETVELLRHASVFGTFFTLKDLSTVLERPAAELTVPLREALDHEVVVDAGGRLAFRHDLIRDAVYEEMPTNVRHALHHQFAGALAAVGSPTTVVAEHYSLGADVGDRTAVEWLRRAAREHAERAPAIAVELLRRALELVPARSPERDELTVDLLRPLVDRGESVAAEELADGVLRRPLDPEPRVRAQRLLAHARLIRGDVVGATAVVDEALSTTAELTEHDRASLLADRANLTVEAVERKALSAEALATARRASNGDAQVRALIAQAQDVRPVAKALGVATAAVDVARQLVAGPRPDSETIYHLGDALLCRAWLGSGLDRFADAEHDLRDALHLAEQIGAVGYVPIIYGEIVKLLWYTGHWDDALAEAETAIELATEVGLDGEVAGVLATQASIQAHSGELDLAQSAIDQAAVLPPPTSDLHRFGLLSARASLHEARGELQAALDVHREAPSLVSSTSTASEVVRLAVALDQMELARSATEAAEQRAAELETPVATATALLCRGLVGGDLDAATDSVAAHRACGRPLSLARACEDAARIAHRRGRGDPARALAEESLRRLEDLGAGSHTPRLQALLRQLGVRRGVRGERARSTSGWDSLTPTELRVVELVRVGLSNAGIGERMYISPRTVSTHLTHVFAKLGVSSRLELVTRATDG